MLTKTVKAIAVFSSQLSGYVYNTARLHFASICHNYLSLVDGPLSPEPP